MWIFLLVQGLIGCAVVIGLAFWEWPRHFLSALLALPFPALFVWGALFMRRRERELKPQRQNYLATNEAARREFNRARLIKWGSIPIVLLVLFVIARSLPATYEPGPLITWIVGGVLLAAIVLPVLYGTLVQSKVEEAATRQATGEPPFTPEAQRNRTIWFVAALALVIGIIAFDQFVDAPVSAMTIFVYGGLVFGAVAFIWRKFNPPRDP
jgi:hypothetical protein